MQNIVNPRYYTVQFGMHRGKLLMDVPKRYVQWMAKNCKDPYAMRVAQLYLMSK